MIFNGFNGPTCPIGDYGDTLARLQDMGVP